MMHTFSDRIECSAIQGVIGQVIWNDKHDYSWIVQHEVLYYQ